MRATCPRTFTISNDALPVVSNRGLMILGASVLCVGLCHLSRG
jgi:hypothetical protein